MFKALSLPFSLYLANQWNNKQKPKCCGILGVLTTKSDAETIVMDGIHLLENRGYDSAGIVSIKQNEEGKNKVIQNCLYLYKLVLTKYASINSSSLKQDCFTKLEQDLHKHHAVNTALGHTRWATCGAKVDHNAHPHLDMNERVALVHNGTLENFHELKKNLIGDHGIKFTSETDTEVIVQYIGVFLRQGMDLMDAVSSTLLLLRGQWGLVVMDREAPEEMIVCRQGSPILVGYNDDSIFAASEKIAFEKYTQTFISLKDGESLQLKLSERQSFFTLMSHRIQTIQCGSPVACKPRLPYTTFYEQEINEQPNSCLRVLGNGGRLAGSDDCAKLGGLEPFEKELCNIRNLVMVGCGSSNQAAQCLLHLFKKMRIFDSISVIEGSEFMRHDIPELLPGVIVISQSGETKDLVKALAESKDQGAFSIGVVNVVGSLIASSVDCGLYLNCGREVGVAASKSFTSQVVALTLLVLWLSKHRENSKEIKVSHSPMRLKIVEQLRSLPMAIGQCLHECQQDVDRVSQDLLKLNTILILGKGPSAAISKEGALKIKELTYKHAEGFSAGELKHGPLALIDSAQEKSTPIILIILNDEHINDMLLALSEVHSRNALTIVITNCQEKLQSDKLKIDHFIRIPFLGREMGWILSVIPFQLIALQLCKLMNINPDKPRNLAKTVTVG